MIHFSPAKINIGLQITERRGDGFHNLQSVMLPVGLCDIIEIRRSTGPNNGIRLSQSGIQLESGNEKNLCIRAYELLSEETPLPPVELHLHKQIPVGAGLGGGSSNASTTLKCLNLLARDPLSDDRLLDLAAILGSDCPFFLYRGAMMMEGRGEILNPIPIHLDQMYLVLIFPEIHVSTAAAYAGATPSIPAVHLEDLVREPIDRWKDLVVNDFENSVFGNHPELKMLKAGLYDAGALYASLSGSGSSIYGIFSKPPDLPGSLERYVIWKGNADSAADTI
ncbi:MAG: 4-(cytidine 5'-diphospho)-2-C-methyl-D-erythritol kinase [Bacteroidales bacterium]|nr:4-(cytidine 5'-diphospho)-2-C-methyl-D-erythritol kinase [Bacteroidales bacterium]